MRQGRDVAVAFASRHDAQDAAVESFARAIALDPPNGDTWDSLSASLFFAGELADSALVAGAGAEIAPSHAGLEAEAAKARAYPAPQPGAESTASAAAAAATARFGDAVFRRVDMPEGSFAESAESVDIQAHAEMFGAAPAVFVSHEPLVSPVRAPRAATNTKPSERAYSHARRTGGVRRDDPRGGGMGRGARRLDDGSPLFRADYGRTAQGATRPQARARDHTCTTHAPRAGPS